MFEYSWINEPIARVDVVKTSAARRASTEVVHELLRADVLGGVYSPGSKLKFAALCQRYCASVSVVREALTRLAEQGLVEAEPNVGFHVRTLTVADLRDLTATRIDLETLALRYSIERGDTEWESRLVAAHHRLDRTQMLTDDAPRRIRDDWEQAHTFFHDALLEGCRSPWLLSLAYTLRGAAEFYRRWSQTQEPNRDVASEHRAITAATLDRDVDEATRLLRLHYQRTASIVEQALTHTPADEAPVE